MLNEHFDVLIVGAGLSGIGAGYHLQQKCPGKSYVILEGRDGIGGTWDLFRYPGIRSDSRHVHPGLLLQAVDRAEGDRRRAPILNYVRETARDNGIDRKIRFGHRVKRASWSSPDARWTVEAERRWARARPKRALHLQFPVPLRGLLHIRGRLHAGIFRARLTSRAHRPPAEVAGRPRLCRQARGGDRLGRDRRDAGAGDGQDCGPRDHAAALADLCGVAAGGGRDRQQAAQEAARQARLSADPLAQRAVRHVFLPLWRAQARPRQAD